MTNPSNDLQESAPQHDDLIARVCRLAYHQDETVMSLLGDEAKLDALMVEIARALEAQQAELTLLREVEKRDA